MQYCIKTNWHIKISIEVGKKKGPVLFCKRQHSRAKKSAKIDSFKTHCIFAISLQGLLYKTNLSCSMPDVPSVTNPKGKPVKFEKLSYSKRITDGQNAPAPSGNRHVTIPLPTTVKLPPIKLDSHQGKTTVYKHPKKRSENSFPNADVFNIVNTTNRTVEYYEHDGHIYVSDNNQSWKDDCHCKICKRNKREYFDSKRKLEEKKMRRMKNPIALREHASPVKEVKEE